MTKANESANPYFFNGQDSNGDPHTDCGRGLTKREYFAAMAMQGICMNADYRLMNLTMVATDAVRHADALIAALNTEAK